MKRFALVLLVTILGGGCSDGGEETRTIVASIYPLAFVAERVAAPYWEVIDLTPTGVEAHDLDLTLEQRSAIQDADVLLYLGDIDFQPQVEAAAQERQGSVIALADQLILRPQEGTDPHIWLDPGAMRTAASLVANEISAPFPRTTAIRRELERLENRFQQVLSLADCKYRVAVVTHEAFNYMIGRYGFEQFGLSGLVPESEPTAKRLAEAQELIDSGEAGAVFYEEHDDAKRVAESFASDAGVPALPLSTLESRPAEGDYFTVMQDNLESLREGLQCE